MVNGTLGNTAGNGSAAAENELDRVECYTERFLLAYCSRLILGRLSSLDYFHYSTASVNNTTEGIKNAPSI